MAIGIPGAYYFWKLGRDPLIFLKILVVIGHVCIYWSKVAEGFSVFNAILFILPFPQEDTPTSVTNRYFQPEIF